MEALCSTTNQEHKEKLRQSVLDQDRVLRRKAQARNARAVVGIGIDQKDHEKWRAQLGRNGLSSNPVQREQVFRSATDASGHLELRHNEVGMMLSRVAATGERQANVRGVTVAYQDDLHSRVTFPAMPARKSTRREGNP